MYCVKCKKSYEPEKYTMIKMKNGMKAKKGKCPKCETPGFEIVGKAYH